MQRKVFSVRRPIDGQDVRIRVVRVDGFFGMAVIQWSSPNGELPVLSNHVRHFVPIRRPNRKPIFWSERNPGGLSPGHGVDPYIIRPRFRVRNCYRNRLSIGGEPRNVIERKRARGGYDVSVAIKDLQFRFGGTFVDKRVRLYARGA